MFVVNWGLAALFLYAYLRLVGVPLEAALVGGAAVCASGYFQGYLALREVPAVAAWWPLLLYGIERAIREPGWRWQHVILAVAMYCTITAGQPEVTFVSLVAALTYGLIRLGGEWRRAWSILGAIVPGTVAGLLLAAPAWVNFTQYAFTAVSAHPASGGLANVYFHPITFAAYIFPYLYGRLNMLPFGSVPGWEWWCWPGWMPATGMFLALVSLAGFYQQRSFALAFLWSVAGITAAKIWGVPGIDALGRLPLFDRVTYPRYAAALLALACAGLAAYGIHAVRQFDFRRWKLWVSGWSALICILLTIGVIPLWPAIRQSALSSETMRTFLIFGGLGLVWAILGPVGLWWLAIRRPREHYLLCFLATLGILLQGVAAACNGYSLATYTRLSLGGLGLYGGSALVFLGLMRNTPVNCGLIGGGCVLVALPSLFTVIFSSYGLPARYNPLTPPPYLKVLTQGPEANLQRVYAFDGAFQANFALPFAITSLNVGEPILPAPNFEFLQRHIDREASPLLFIGNLSGRHAESPVVNEFWRNKRYFDLVGVRYVVTQGSSPQPVLYSTGTAGVARVAVPVAQPLEMSFPCPTDSLSNIAVFLSTYIRSNPGTVSLKLFSDTGVLLRQQDLEGKNLLDNSFQEFVFPPLLGVKGQQLRARLEFAPARSGSMIAASISPTRPDFGFALRVAGTGPELTLMHKDPHTQVQVWENHAAVPRVFLAPTARVVTTWQEALAQLPSTPDLTHQVWIEQGPEVSTAWPETQAAGELREFELTPNTVRIYYEAKTTGILTLTDSYAEGWRVSVNGREVPVVRVDGVFREVRLEEAGTYEVRFWYRPPYWMLSLSLALGGGLLLAAASWYGGRGARG